MKKLKILLMNLAKRSLVFRNFARKSMYAIKTAKYRITALFRGVDEKSILFCSFGGSSYSCSPKAIYEYMLNNEKYKSYKFTWIFSNPEKYKFLEENENTTVISNHGAKYNKTLMTTKYFFFNYNISDYIVKRKAQVFIQCWHGTPLKRLGFDLLHYDSALNTLKEMKRRYRDDAKKTSYFVSPSKYCTEKYISAWDLKSVQKENNIIEEGYPRNDFLLNFTEDDVIKIKNKILGYNETKKKIILYAPTFRANQHDSEVGYTYKEELDFEKLREKLENEYIILFRPHYFVANSFDFDKYRNFVYNVADIDDVNELYVISDILVTDYSSVFYYYANLKRPMIFYMYDLEHYRDESNGFYFDVEEELPGKIVRTDDELIEEIVKVTNEFTYEAKYKKFNEKFNYLDDGNASERVVEKVIGE